MITAAVALASIVLSVAAQFALKCGVAGVPAATDASTLVRTLPALLARPCVLLGLTLYGTSAVLWLQVLMRWDVSKAYPMVGLGFALAVLAGWVLGETVTMQRALAVAVIIAGLVTLART